MQTKLLSIASAVAFVFGVTAAGVTAAQSTMSDKPRVGEPADRTADAKPGVDRKARKAEEDRIEADYKAEKAKCNSMKGNEKEACEADAKGKEDVACEKEAKAKYERAKADIKARTAATERRAVTGSTTERTK